MQPETKDIDFASSDPNYRAALSQLAKVLVRFTAESVHGIIEEDGGMILLLDLNGTIANEHPKFYHKLAELSGARTKPTPADIRIAIANAESGNWIDPSVTPVNWGCRLYQPNGEFAVDGQALTADQAMAMAWLNCWGPRRTDPGRRRAGHGPARDSGRLAVRAHAAARKLMPTQLRWPSVCRRGGPRAHLTLTTRAQPTKENEMSNSAIDDDELASICDDPELKAKLGVAPEETLMLVLYYPDSDADPDPEDMAGEIADTLQRPTVIMGFHDGADVVLAFKRPMPIQPEAKSASVPDTVPKTTTGFFYPANRRG